ncbi:hypothetical protein AGMMS4952_23190 [Spirochaetia bacterium]|nr:hypothetical protein AGMMS4952_23190 [Spirochaetia bacterium]
MGEEKLQFNKLMGLMPDGWEGKAKELKALQRAVKIKTPEELLRLIFLYKTCGKVLCRNSSDNPNSRGMEAEQNGGMEADKEQRSVAGMAV